MNRPTTNFATSGLPGQHDDSLLMTDDESSRDSGISMTLEGSPTCFSSLQSSQNYDSNAMEVEEDGGGVAASSPPKRRTKTEFRRCLSHQRKLFDESPVSHTKFVRPTLTLRDNNHELFLRRPDQRKRSLEGNEWVPSKIEKRERSSHASDHYHLESMDVDPYDSEDDHEKAKVAAFTLQSTSRVRSFVRHHSTSAIMQHDKENEEVDKEANGHLIVNYQLNTLSARCSTTYRRITAKTLCDVMQADQEFNDKFMLIDCRYPFEFEGGHIKNSINFFNRDQVSSFFFKEDNTPRFNKIPIFYCEFSQKRGPSMAYALREDDRKRNEDYYPHCAYEEMYVVDKGFCDFFKYTKQEKITSLCESHNYIRMHEPKFAHKLKDYNYHRRGNTGGTTVMRHESASVLTRSNTSSSESTMLRSASSVDFSQNSTPANRAKQPYCRTLFQDNTNSPTQFPQSSVSLSLTPPSKSPLCQPQFT